LERSSFAGGSTLIEQSNFMPMEQMHYIAVKHHQYTKKIEKEFTGS
jgi:hypothetical protein